MLFILFDLHLSHDKCLYVQNDGVACVLAGHIHDIVPFDPPQCIFVTKGVGEFREGKNDMISFQFQKLHRGI